jgi:hypothetical protein
MMWWCGVALGEGGWMGWRRGAKCGGASDQGRRVGRIGLRKEGRLSRAYDYHNGHFSQSEAEATTRRQGARGHRRHS